MKKLLMLCLIGFAVGNPVLIESSYPMIGVNPEHRFQAPAPAQVNGLNWEFPVAISPLGGPITVRHISDSLIDFVVFAGESAPGHSFLYCLRANGGIHWRNSLPAPVKGFPAFSVINEQIVVSSGDSLISFHLISGSRFWARRLMGNGWHPTIWHNIVVYAADEAGYLSAYDLMTGSLGWRQGPLGGGLFNTTATVDSLGNVYVGTLGNQLQWYDWRVHFFDSLGNERRAPIEYLAFEPGGIRMTMALISLDKVVHHNYWQTYWTCGVYGISFQGVLWRYSPFDFQTKYSSIAFDGQKLYLGTSEGLLILDTLGNFIRLVPVGPITYSSPLIDSLGQILVGNDAGVFYILNSNGQIIFQYSTNTSPLGSASIGLNGDIYIAGQTKLFCFTYQVGLTEEKTRQIVIKMVKSGEIYDILGRRVKGLLRRGIYFQDGDGKKKIVVR